MSSESTARSEPNATFQKVYLALCVGLFIYGLLGWRGAVGDARPWEPLRFLALTGGMLLQAIAPVLRPRSTRLSGSLLLASFVALALAFVVRA